LGAKVSQARTREQTIVDSAAQAEKDLQTSKAAVDNLETVLSSRPGISADEFGRQLQITTAKLAKDAINARKAAAGYETVFKNAGESPIVDTSGLINSITKLEKQTRNPSLQNILSEIKSQATTGAKVSETGEFLGGDSKLSARSADSLKGYLDSIISSKMHKSSATKLDKETLLAIQNLKNQLFQATKNAVPEYGNAVNTFRVMSRPLDIVERNGSLRKVIDQDPVSTANRMTEAEVTGHVIRRANAGSPVFTRLLQVNPEIKESARLYFTKDLFGKDAAPTTKGFENWLIANERSLRQTGLYDEFSTLRNAHRAAKNAVDEAKGVAEIRKTQLSQAESERQAAEKLAKKGTSRLETALKTAETPEQIAKRAARRTEEVRPIVTKFASQEAKEKATADTLSELKSNLRLATKSKDIKTSVDNTADKLKDLGLIDEAQRSQIQTEVSKLGENIENRDNLYKTIAKIVGGGIVGNVVYKYAPLP